MSTTARRYARKTDIARVVDGARSAGLAIGGIECLPDGTVRVMTAAPSIASAYERWQDQCQKAAHSG
jgi:hypothetical protein